VDQRAFVDLNNNTIRSVFKLYPWEWLLRDDVAPQLLKNYPFAQWVEPIWKMLLSNKGILPILWELFPGHDNLLECYFDSPNNLTDYVRKPLLSRGRREPQRSPRHDDPTDRRNLWRGVRLSSHWVNPQFWRCFPGDRQLGGDGVAAGNRYQGI